ncbi:MAG TPA: hypothetical protein VIR30_18495 [Nocardioides sp.]
MAWPSAETAAQLSTTVPSGRASAGVIVAVRSADLTLAGISTPSPVKILVPSARASIRSLNSRVIAVGAVATTAPSPGVLETSCAWADAEPALVSTTAPAAHSTTAAAAHSRARWAHAARAQ